MLSTGRALYFFIPRLNIDLSKAVESLGIAAPTRIQREAFFPILRGDNFRGIAPTGEGKTYAYLVPLLQRASDEKYTNFASLIVVPTRELLRQVTASLVGLDPLVKVEMIDSDTTSFDKLNSATFLVAQISALQHILHKRPEILSNLRTLVLDEADAYRGKKTLEIFARLIKPGTQVLTFQATGDKHDSFSLAPISLTHVKARASGSTLHDKLSVVRRIVEEEISDQPKHKVLIFVRNGREAEIVSRDLRTSCMHRK